MKKRIISLFLTLAVTFSIVCPLAFADDSSAHVHNWESTAVPDFSDTVNGIPVSVSVKKCSECKFYKHTYTFFGNSFDFISPVAYTSIVEDLLLDVSLHIMNVLGQNATAKKYETGGGSGEGSSGVGRRPSGYADDNGTPTVDIDGEFQILIYPDLGKTSSAYQKYPDISFVLNAASYSVNVSGISGSIKALASSFSASYLNVPIYYRYRFTAPVDGVYYIKSYQCTVSNVLSVSGGDFRNYGYQPGSVSKTYPKGDTNTFVSGSQYFDIRPLGYGEQSSYSFSFHPIVLTCIPDASSCSKKSTITINQNVWNGNIYQDNSTNLTYIYPQYTTVNENNETVTNISENPIIYDSTTNQYYTYDSVTNNYYYITYVTETPTPTPSPDPTPTPDPGTGPTPTPEPGEDIGDTTGILAVLVQIRDNLIQGFADIKATLAQGWADLSANFTLAIENLTINIQNFFQKGLSGSKVDPNIPGGGSFTPETGDKGDGDSDSSSSGSGWNWNPLKWLSDLLQDIVEKILKSIWKLITGIFGFLLWLLSLVGKVLPFLPSQAVLALTAGAIIVTILRIIKFITGR